MAGHVIEVDEFNRLLNDEWNIKVTAAALHQLSDLNCRKPQLLPLTQDIVKYNRYRD